MLARRLLLQVTLALAVALGQQGAVLHELAHALDAVKAHQDGQAPHEEFCDKCLAFAPFGGSITSADFHFAVAIRSCPPVASDVALRFVATAAAPYQSRAPPRLA